MRIANQAVANGLKFEIETMKNLPRWYFGWNIVAAASFMTLLTVGMRMGIGPFFMPMMNDLNMGRSDFALVVAVGMLCYGVSMPAAGYLTGRLGTRAVLLIGTSIVVIAAIWTSMVTSGLTLLLAYGVTLSVGLGLTSPVALTPIIARWFTRRRGMALFFLSTGSMAGIGVMTPAFTWAIGTLGWRETMLVFAGLFAVVNVPLSLFVMTESAPPETDTLLGGPAPAAKISQPAAAQPLLVRDAIATPDFWKVVLGMFTCGFSMNLLGTHGVPMLMDHGFDAMCSSMGIGSIGMVAIFSSLVLGRISDRVEHRKMLATIYLVRGLGFFALVSVGTQWELFLAATIGGIVWSGSIAMSSAILADVYGVRLVGVLYGWAYLGHQIGAALSSWFGGWGFDHFGSHWPAFGSAGILLLVAAGISMQLPRPHRAMPVAA
jgi:MFS family permease